MDLRARIEKLEKVVYDYIKEDKARLLEQQEELKKELRAARNATARAQNKFAEYKDKRKNALKKVKTLIESE